MPVCGDLTTMSLVELLRWASQGQRTGVLEVEQNRICRRIEFRKGWIGACASDDPPAQLGHILLSRDRIDEDLLREALARQENTGHSLGVILVQMGVLTPREVARYVAEKAEDTIQGLFDWEEAAFPYHEGATLEPDQIEVNLSVDEIIDRGLKHQEELKKIRKHFKSSGIVLACTRSVAPGKLVSREMPRRIYESVDGERTIAEILLHTHAAAFLVIKFLYRLYEVGLVKVTGEQPLSPNTITLLDVPAPKRRREKSSWTADDIRELVEGALPRRTPLDPERPSELLDDTTMRLAEIDEEVEVATRMLSRREFSAALELLNATYRANPGENYLRRLIFRAEEAYVESLRRRNFSYDRTPTKVEEVIQDPAVEIRSEESFLLSLIDGVTDIKSILWLSPLREVDVLRALEQMQDRGLISIDSPQTAASRDLTPRAADQA
jgi:hypothetical protein